MSNPYVTFVGVEKDDLDANEVVSTNGNKKSSAHEYCWYTGQKCGADSCNIGCPIYRAL